MYVVLSDSFKAVQRFPPPNMIERDDHEGLASYYTKQAQKFMSEAQQWENWAKFYESHYRRSPHGRLAPARHAAHCRMIAQSYRKAAEEAEALAEEHGKSIEPRRD